MAEQLRELDDAWTVVWGYYYTDHCMRDRYRVWKAGGKPGRAGYPWKVLPK